MSQVDRPFGLLRDTFATGTRFNWQSNNNEMTVVEELNTLHNCKLQTNSDKKFLMITLMNVEHKNQINQREARG